MSTNKKISDLCDELKMIEEKRNRKKNKFVSQQNKGLKLFSKGGLLMGLYVVGALSVVGGGTYLACQKAKEYCILNKQEQVCNLIRNVDEDTKKRIYHKYDDELLMLINQYQSGKKTNGYKMSPKNAVFMAHSDLLYKYNAYNPNVQEDNRSTENWILLDHMCYRYYQYRNMTLSNVRGDTSNAYSDMLRSDRAGMPQRVSVRYNNLFEGLKLDNIMKR